MKKALFVGVIVSMALLSLIVFSSCSSSSAPAENALELVKIVTHEPEEVFYGDEEESTQQRSSDIYVRNITDEPITYIGLERRLMDESGTELNFESADVGYVLLPGQTGIIRIDVDPMSVWSLTEDDVDQVTQYQLTGSYSFRTVSGELKNGELSEVPEPVILGEASTLNISEETPCDNSEINGDVIISETPSDLLVTSLECNGWTATMQVKNTSDKRTDAFWINLVQLDENGNIYRDYAAECAEFLNPGDTTTVTMEGMWLDNNETAYVTAVSYYKSGTDGTKTTVFSTIPKAVKFEW